MSLAAPDDIRLLCFPQRDVTFCSLATAAAEAQPGTPEVLQDVLRRTYPEVVVREQDRFAALGAERRWYVYRDGHLGTQSQDQWWQDQALPRVAIGSDNRYLEANDAACSLFGVPPGSLVGDSWETFALQPSIEAAAALRAALQQHGHGESTFRLRRPDASIFDIDYHTIVYRGDDGPVYETVMRERQARPVESTHGAT